MKNFVKPGNHITVDGPTTSGLGKLVGTSLFGVAIATVASGEKGELVVEGEVEVAKLSTDVMAVGAKVNWNDTNEEVQNATSDLDGVGTVSVAAGNGDTTVRIKLTPV